MKSALIIVTPLFVGWILDLLLGDPEWLPHPVRVIGWLIQRLEGVLRRRFPKNAIGETRAGIMLATFVPLISMLVTAMLLALAARVHIGLWMALETVLCYQILATRCLNDESMHVLDPLEKADLSAARQAVSRIVGRDTEALDEQGIIRATVETVAEGTTDGVVAPMFFLAIGGASLGIMYKCVNTLDSMVGYKNEKYLYFGAASAKLDDICNFIPARLAAILMILSAGLAGLDCKNALKIFRRDRLKHTSPNSAQTESVCAGALGISLGGGSFYDGVFCEKPAIGDDDRPAESADIRHANRLMLLTSFLCAALLITMKFVVYGIIIK